MGKDLHKRRIEKYYRETRRRSTVALERTDYPKLFIHSKIYSSDVNLALDCMRIPHRTGLEP